MIHVTHSFHSNLNLGQNLTILKHSCTFVCKAADVVSILINKIIKIEKKIRENKNKKSGKTTIIETLSPI